MAKNQLRVSGARYRVDPTDPQSPASGDPFVFGQIPAVAVAGTLADGTCIGAFEGVWALSVKGINHAGNVAVNGGDVLYLIPSSGEDPPVTAAVLCKDSTSGVRFGYALPNPEGGADPLVASGAVATIAVKVGY